MGEKIKNVLIGIWGLILYVSIAFGIVDIIEKIFHICNSYTISIAGLFTIGSFIVIVYLLVNEEKNTTKEVLTNMKMLYSLDYSNLKNIKRIEIIDKDKYIVILNREDKEIQFGLNKNYVPKNQEMLIKLDTMYNKYLDLSKNKKGDENNDEYFRKYYR